MYFWSLFYIYQLIISIAANETGTDTCLICEFVGIAASQADAIAMFQGVDEKIQLEPCLHGTNSSEFDAAVAIGSVVENTVEKYCVTKVFMFEAKDISKWVYGIVRLAAEEPVFGWVELDHFDGIFAWSESFERSNSSQHWSMMDISPITQNQMVSDKSDNMPVRLPQRSAMMVCVNCHATETMITYPDRSSDIKDPCWNPSSSHGFDAHFSSRHYCIAKTGTCFTDTFQYATKDSNDLKSYTIGIRRGCSTIDPGIDSNISPLHLGERLR